MRKIKNIIGSAVVAAALGCSSMMTSCTDYLTIYPTNTVILENYWKTAEDVNAMLATCYSSMANSDVIKRMMIWGELRADNMTTRSSASTDLKYIVDANLLETNSYFKWEKFYATINYCNILIKYAPGVLNEDPDFTQGDLDVILGEAYALRAFCHFTLVRSFGRVPMSFVAMDADNQPMVYPQYSPYEALDSVYVDLQRATALCMKSGGWSDNKKNVSRITKNAVYAMMADVNLWRAACAAYTQKATAEEKDILYVPSHYTVGDPATYCTMAIENCDSVLVNMKRKLFKDYEDENRPMTGLDTLSNPYYLCVNDPLKIKEYPTIYDEIFWGKEEKRDGYKSPQEVIFKLDFSTNNYNNAVSDFYGYDKSSGSFQVPSKADIALEDGLYESNDTRYSSYISAGKGGTSSGGNEGTVYDITKYVIKTANREKGIEYQKAGLNESDWIFYRQTDVLLMKAQALAFRYTPAEVEGDLSADHKEAFKIVQSVNRRNLSVLKDTLQSKDFKSQEDLKTLVFDERLRELTYEGKRWYDLVQKALWEGKTSNIVELIIKKLDNSSGSVSSKMQHVKTLFCPVYEKELILNPLLKQNPAFERNSSTELN